MFTSIVTMKEGMVMLNNVVLMGRLTRDPEIRHTQSGIPVANFSLAVERDYAPQQGEKAVDFINCVAWRSTAEIIGKHVTKGQLIVINGRLQTREWTDQSGGKRYATEVVAENMYFTGKREQSGEQQGSTSDFVELDDDDDTPF